MWIWKINSEKTKFGFFKIPKNCVNAEWGRFEELLKIDERKEVKSAVVNWFNYKHNGINFWVGLNGYDSILLMADGGVEEEIYFRDFQVFGEYLVHFNDVQDWYKNKDKIDRSIKIDKILRNVKKLQKSHS